MKCTFMLRGERNHVMSFLRGWCDQLKTEGVNMIRADSYIRTDKNGVELTAPEEEIHCVRCKAALVNYIWLKMNLRKTSTTYLGWGDPK